MKRERKILIPVLNYTNKLIELRFWRVHASSTDEFINILSYLLWIVIISFPFSMKWLGNLFCRQLFRGFILLKNRTKSLIYSVFILTTAESSYLDLDFTYQYKPKTDKSHLDRCGNFQKISMSLSSYLWILHILHEKLLLHFNRTFSNLLRISHDLISFSIRSQALNCQIFQSIFHFCPNHEVSTPFQDEFFVEYCPLYGNFVTTFMDN